MVGGILTGHEADPGRGADGAGIGVGEKKAFFRQSRHVWSPVLPIEFRFHGVEIDRGVLPTHVIDKEEENIEFASGGGGKQER